MPKHEIKHTSGGSAEMSWIQPVCSCGWVGSKRYGYEDYQYALVKQQEAAHLARPDQSP